ncbi:MAG: hypothetical protein D6820_06885 [Lentisphaerae bacterium]|nr:MAG: hypothetical protein D6820_06885 [Lentisphaerota bacterium]
MKDNDRPASASPNAKKEKLPEEWFETLHFLQGNPCSHPSRFFLMSVLMRQGGSLDFVNLRNLTQFSDGNVASHVNILEKAQFIVVQRRFENKVRRTTIHVTPEGYRQFRDFLDSLANALVYASEAMAQCPFPAHGGKEK